MSASMTGFGRGEAAEASLRLVVEIKSVNNRYCDIQVRMPRTLYALEMRVRELISRRISRGKVDVFVNFTDTGPDSASVSCNYALAHAYTEAIRKIALNEDIALQISASRIAGLPDVMQVEPIPAPLDQVRPLLETAVEQALDGLCQMRRLEGGRLAVDIAKKAKKLEKLRQEIAAWAPMVVTEYRTRLLARIDELLADQAAEIMDEARLAAEIALFADKCSVDEELVRLASHLAQLAGLVSQEGPVGKKLDFLVQEINREVNTIGAKANDLALTGHVVQMKCEVEKIREQVQNLE